ncbi:hypothetical protein ACRAKI_19760 [Saccharothrix isguenensis]
MPDSSSGIAQIRTVLQPRSTDSANARPARPGTGDPAPADGPATAAAQPRPQWSLIVAHDEADQRVVDALAGR